MWCQQNSPSAIRADAWSGVQSMLITVRQAGHHGPRPHLLHEGVQQRESFVENSILQIVSKLANSCTVNTLYCFCEIVVYPSCIDVAMTYQVMSSKYIKLN